QLNKQQKEIGVSAEQSRGKLAAAIEEAIRHHQDFMATAERASLQARQSGEAAHSQTAELAKTAERASAELRAMGDQATDHIEQLNMAASKAESQGSRLANVTRSSLANINEASGSAKVHMEELADISVRAKEHAEAMEEILQHETMALAEIAQQLTEQVEKVEQTLSERSSLLDQSVEQASEASERFHRRTVELARASELMIKGIKYADQALEKHKLGIDDTRRHIHEDLHLVTEKISEASRQVKDAGSGAAKLFYGRAQDLIEFTTKANESARELGDQFDNQHKKLTLSVQQVESTLSKSASILKEESESFRATAEKAAEDALMSGMKIEKQTEKLNVAAEKAKELADRIAENKNKIKNERFMKSTAFIMENLNSLTIDLSRIMDSSLSEDLWRRYRKGEKGIFTRKLLKSRDAEKIRARYRDSGDFRRFADQYVSEFREIMTEAGSVEHSELLSDAFITADVGKVYLLLQEALEGLE
ncbi:MAG: hypothetical protein K9G33_00430, partial [Sneathiella sp.]|nr:hypothetical protein [Sneathiella sp.]